MVMMMCMFIALSPAPMHATEVALPGHGTCAMLAIAAIRVVTGTTLVKVIMGLST